MRAKMFIGSPEIVEDRLNAWLKNKRQQRVRVKFMFQSQSATSHDTVFVVITVIYDVK